MSPFSGDRYCTSFPRLASPPKLQACLWLHADIILLNSFLYTRGIGASISSWLSRAFVPDGYNGFYVSLCKLLFVGKPSYYASDSRYKALPLMNIYHREPLGRRCKQSLLAVKSSIRRVSYKNISKQLHDSILDNNYPPRGYNCLAIEIRLIII